MCRICQDLESDKITLTEARRNLIELRMFDHIDDDHYFQVIEKINQFQELQDNQTNVRSLKKDVALSE